MVVATRIKQTTSLCPHCLARIEADVVERDGEVWMEKRCPEHGDFAVQLASDARHYHVADPAVSALGSCCGPGRHCGDQSSNHSCNLLIELTQQCNLTCPTCYAGSSPAATGLLPFERFVDLVDGLLSSGKGDADLVQLSGGEPTLHPRIFDCIRYALEAGVKRVYVNTNGLRLANRSFAEKLVEFGDRVSVYLQLDGFDAATHATIRGDGSLGPRKLRALEHCEALGIDVVPVVTLTAGVNDHELGAILARAEASPAIQRVMIQPAMVSGRYENDHTTARLGIADVARLVSEQTGGRFTPEDFGPIPCSDPNCFAMAVALKTPGGLLPISRYFPRYEDWADGANAAMIAQVSDTFDSIEGLQEVVGATVASGALAALDGRALDAILDAVMQTRAADGGWRGMLVIGVKPFMDAWSYDQDRIDKCCVHIVAADGTPVSFCEYNAVRRPLGVG